MRTVASRTSAALAYGVPALLMPDRVGESYLAELVDLERLPDGETGGASCFRVRGHTPADSSVELWIDRTTFLIRRIDKAGGKSSPAHSTVHFKPEINAALARREFFFSRATLWSRRGWAGDPDQWPKELGDPPVDRLAVYRRLKELRRQQEEESYRPWSELELRQWIEAGIGGDRQRQEELLRQH